MITKGEVLKHRTADDCWVVIHGKVYDVSKFLMFHPGGTDIILNYSGSDATISFELFGHSEQARKLMEKYYVGEFFENPVDNPHRGNSEGRATKRTPREIWDYNTNCFYID